MQCVTLCVSLSKMLCVMLRVNNWKAKVAKGMNPGSTDQGNKIQEATSMPTEGAGK